MLDEHLAARGFIVSWDHPDVGCSATRAARPLRATPVHIGHAPTLGEDNRDILRELGCSDEQIDALEAGHVVTSEPPAD